VRPQPTAGWGILLLIAAVCIAVYWIVRFCVYASGLVWVPALVVCAPMWLRVFVGSEALKKHKQLAWVALGAGAAPLLAYAIASEFDMLSNPFPWTPVSLGSMLLASLGICAGIGGASLLIGMLHARLARLDPGYCSNHGAGALALIPRIKSKRRWSYSLDALLALCATVGLFLGETLAQIAGVLAAMLIYTWVCDFVYRDRVAFRAFLSHMSAEISASFKNLISLMARKFRSIFRKRRETDPAIPQSTAGST
jgi:hypothetical protein